MNIRNGMMALLMVGMLVTVAAKADEAQVPQANSQGNTPVVAPVDQKSVPESKPAKVEGKKHRRGHKMEKEQKKEEPAKQ
jgi:hypothetical protein